MNTLKVKLEPWAFRPTRAHKFDAGMDMRSPFDVIIPAGESRTIDTGVSVEVPENMMGLLVSKSGLNVKKDITSVGVIDTGYTGKIAVCLRNHGKNDYFVHEGDKISQLVFVPIWIPNNIVEVDEFDETERGDSGFGSTGR